MQLCTLNAAAHAKGAHSQDIKYNNIVNSAHCLGTLLYEQSNPARGQYRRHQGPAGPRVTCLIIITWCTSTTHGLLLVCLLSGGVIHRWRLRPGQSDGRILPSKHGQYRRHQGPADPGVTCYNNLVHKYNTLAATGLPAVGRRDSRMEALTRAIGRSYPALQARPISPSSGPGLPGGNLFDHNNLNYVHRITFVTCLIIIT